MASPQITPDRYIIDLGFVAARIAGLTEYDLKSKGTVYWSSTRRQYYVALDPVWLDDEDLANLNIKADSHGQ